MEPDKENLLPDDGQKSQNDSNGNEETYKTNDEHRFKDEVLKPLKYFFMVAGQCWLPEYPTILVENARKYKAKLTLYTLWQIVIACSVAVYFPYALGIWGPRDKRCDLTNSFLYYPITWIENAIWELRWLMTCLLGILLTKGIWQELYIKNKISFKDEDETTRKEASTKVKHVAWALSGALIFLWVMSEVGNLSEINFSITHDNWLPIFLDALFTLLDRLIAFPLFFLFCITMYALCCMVEEYRDKIVKWKRGENSARERFREIKAAIHIAGLSFEVYLMVHFLLLVCTFFLGVCACFEQMEVTIADNYTVFVPFQIPHSARYIHFYGYGNFTLDTHASAAHPAASWLTTSYALGSFSQSQGHTAANGVNSTLRAMDRDALLTKYLKHSMKTIFFCTLVKTLESLLLYLVPVGLMARLQNRLRRVYEVIEDCNNEKQRDKGYLFDNVDVIRRMCKYVKTAHGLKIFGYTVPTFETFMLAAFGPFFAVVVQSVLSRIHLKQ